MAEHYQRPGWFTTNVFNRVVGVLTRLGVSVYGSRVLEVRGRRSGEWRQTPVNLLRYEGAEYLVSPRVTRNGSRTFAQVKGGCVSEAHPVVRRGRTHRQRKATATPSLLDAVEVRGRRLFAGVGPDSSDEDLRHIAPDHPVFRVTGT